MYRSTNGTTSKTPTPLYNQDTPNSAHNRIHENVSVRCRVLPKYIVIIIILEGQSHKRSLEQPTKQTERDNCGNDCIVTTPIHSHNQYKQEYTVRLIKHLILMKL